MHTAEVVSGCHHVSEELSTHTPRSPRCTPSPGLEASPDHLSWLTGHAASTGTPTNFCVCIRQGGACKPREAVGAAGRGDISPIKPASRSKYGTYSPIWDSQPRTVPRTAKSQSTACASRLNSVGAQRLVCWQVRERGERGAASSHYSSTGCLPGASEGTGRLAYICYPLLWLQTDLWTDFFFFAFFFCLNELRRACSRYSQDSFPFLSQRSFGRNHCKWIWWRGGVYNCLPCSVAGAMAASGFAVTHLSAKSFGAPASPCQQKKNSYQPGCGTEGLTKIHPDCSKSRPNLSFGNQPSSLGAGCVSGSLATGTQSFS